MPAAGPAVGPEAAPCAQHQSQSLLSGRSQILCSYVWAGAIKVNKQANSRRRGGGWGGRGSGWLGQASTCSLVSSCTDSTDVQTGQVQRQKECLDKEDEWTQGHKDRQKDTQTDTQTDSAQVNARNGCGM